MNPIKVIQFGVNGLGTEVLRLIAARPDLELVAIIDPRAQAMTTAPADEFGVPGARPVTHGSPDALRHISAHVVTHCTDSGLAAAYPEILAVVSAGKGVISNCAELALPWARNSGVAAGIESQARRTGARVLGVGAMVGFPVGMLAMAAASGCGLIRSLTVTRLITLQPEDPERLQRAGVGLSVEGFKAAVEGGAVGFAGLGEYLALAADTIGWSLDSVEETIEPILARRKTRNGHGVIAKGAAEGLRQRALGTIRGRQVISIEIEASSQLENPSDEIVIDGVPPMTLRVPGGIDDLRATAALMVSCIPAVVSLPRVGILALHELPLAPYTAFNPAPPDPPAHGGEDEPLIVAASAENR